MAAALIIVAVVVFLAVIYLIMAGVLMFRPEGLFKRETARRI